jgi:hypothetical protein
VVFTRTCSLGIMTSLLDFYLSLAALLLSLLEVFIHIADRSFMAALSALH